MEPSLRISPNDETCKVVPYIPPLRRIAIEIGHKHRLTLDQLRSDRRLPTYCAARFEFYFRAMIETNSTVNGIGRFINRDHSTVLYGATKFAKDRGLPSPPKCYGRGSYPRKPYPYSSLAEALQLSPP